MATANDVLNIAASRIGYYAPNDPLPGSEAGRYVADLWASFPNATAAHSAGVLNWEAGASWLRGPSTSIWWCCLFVSMCLDMAGVRNIAGFPNYNCDNTISKVRAAHMKKIFIRSSKYDATPGDIVMFDWGGDGSCDHVGFIRENCGSFVRTIEGNTSGSANGSQSAGNGVWPRERSWSTIRYVIHIEYEEEDEMPQPADLWNYDNAMGKVNEINARAGSIENKASEINGKLDNVLNKVYATSPIVPFGGPVHRLYNRNGNGAHAMTNSPDLISDLTSVGWTDEGALFELGTDGEAVWGLYNPNTDDYLLTANQNEARGCVATGWISWGIIGTIGDGPEVYRLYNGHVPGGQHLFTVNANEVKSLISQGWTDEGVALKAVK